MTRTIAVAAFAALTTLSASAAPVAWADWLSGTTGASGSASGIITANETVNVSYTGEIAFINTLPSQTNYFIPSAPYISATVDNAPAQPDMIALSRTGRKTLSFDKPVSNLLFAVVSLNGNGYTFDQDFEILSTGAGFWGNGSLAKVDLGNGQFQLNGSGEPHGVIEFTGTFNSVSWTSQTNEFWNGFNVGIRGVVVPEPTSLAAFALVPALLRRRRA
jgi:hypothetical protein